MDWWLRQELQAVGVAEGRRLIRPPQVHSHCPHCCHHHFLTPLLHSHCPPWPALVVKKCTQRAQAQVVVHGLHVVHNCPLILPFLSTPGAEGATTSLT